MKNLKSKIAIAITALMLAAAVMSYSTESYAAVNSNLSVSGNTLEPSCDRGPHIGAD